ncbi:MAG: hypothetical protein CL482_00745 [Acidobacteria bacterium]|nr:hypothetical protein [Acidobacteriota bacterium]
MRVNRSTRRLFGLVPRLSPPRKLVVSTTNVSPSQCPRDTPENCLKGGVATSSIGMIRALCTISLRITT